MTGAVIATGSRARPPRHLPHAAGSSHDLASVIRLPSHIRMRGARRPVAARS